MHVLHTSSSYLFLQRKQWRYIIDSHLHGYSITFSERCCSSIEISNIQVCAVTAEIWLTEPVVQQVHQSSKTIKKQNKKYIYMFIPNRPQTWCRLGSYQIKTCISSSTNSLNWLWRYWNFIISTIFNGFLVHHRLSSWWCWVFVIQCWITLFWCFWSISYGKCICRNNSSWTIGWLRYSFRASNFFFGLLHRYYFFSNGQGE